MACPHVGSLPLNTPDASQSVFRDECTLCFDSVDDENGLDVCLSCFNGGCSGYNNHAHSHALTLNHPLAVNIQRKRRVSAPHSDASPKVLAIAAESEADRFTFKLNVRCHECNLDNIDLKQGKLGQVVEGIMNAPSFSQQQEIKAWQQEIQPCEHLFCLDEAADQNVPCSSSGHCSACSISENLWLCLSCGNLGCGRSQWGGVGGNSHALAHSQSFAHPIAVKLGSLSPDGPADVYCYFCDEERLDPSLPEHLRRWGIDIESRTKTEKNMTELQLDQNMKWDFSMIDSHGLPLRPLFGPGLTGLKNLGNTCYMNSCLQVLFAIPEFCSRYWSPVSPPQRPALDLETQMRRLADGLLSGRYSTPSHSNRVHKTSEPEWQQGISPVILKSIVGKDHPEFSTMRQQDASEFFQYFLSVLSKTEASAMKTSLTRIFEFALEERLQCQACQKVRYTTVVHQSLPLVVPIRRSASEPDKFDPVTLAECLDIFTAPELVDFTCPACQSSDGFLKQSLFKTFPTVLVLNPRRFEYINWVPIKRDVPIIVSEGDINLDAYLSAGLQAGENLLPDDAPSLLARMPNSFSPDPRVLDELLQMGFPQSKCEKALQATGNSGAAAALDWLVAHIEDDAIDATQVTHPLDEQSVLTLTSLGFTQHQAQTALKHTNGILDQAVDWILSHPEPSNIASLSENAISAQSDLPGVSHSPINFCLESIICHKGTSIHAGHYVAFVKKSLEPDSAEKSWVLFNDEKVAVAVDAMEMKQFAYLYFFRLSSPAA